MKKAMIKHKIGFLLVVFAIVSCCGCGVGADQNNMSNVSEPANSEPAENILSTDTAAPSESDRPAVVLKNSETTIKEKRLENDFIRIWCANPARGVYCTVIENLDGSGRQEAEGDEFIGNELWLTNDWFYYHISGSELDRDTVYRAPVSYEKNKAKIHFKKEEKLFEGKDFDKEDILITDSYIIYSDYDDDKTADTYYQYDFETKTVSKLFDMPDEAMIVENAENGLPMIFRNSFFITTGKDDDRSVYAVSLDTFEKRVLQQDVAKENLSEEKSDHDRSYYFISYYLPNGDMTEQDGAVYFAPDGSRVMRYDGENEEPACVLDEASLHQIMKAWDLWGDKASHLRGTIMEVYACGGRLYLIVYVEWDQQEKVRDGKEKIIKRNYSSNILMSAAISDFSGWELEDKFTNYLRKHNIKGYDEDDDRYYCMPGEIIRRMGGGGILFCLTPDSQQKEARKKTILYDLVAGDFQIMDDDSYLCWDVRPPY